MIGLFAFDLLGKLGWSQFPTNAIEAGGASMIVLGVLFIVALITYLKRWTWLWKEWFTTQDPKRIGVMYIIVALVMLLRGGGDAILMRLQQSISVGNNHGILSSSHFSADSECAWHDHDFLCSHGSHVWDYQPGIALTDRGARCGLPIF